MRLEMRFSLALHTVEDGNASLSALHEGFFHGAANVHVACGGDGEAVPNGSTDENGTVEGDVSRGVVYIAGNDEERDDGDHIALPLQPSIELCPEVVAFPGESLSEAESGRFSLSLGDDLPLNVPSRRSRCGGDAAGHHVAPAYFLDEVEIVEIHPTVGVVIGAP